MKKRYKKVYNSDVALGQAFASRTLSPIGNEFTSPSGHATHDVLWHRGTTVALWKHDAHFVTTYWSGLSGRGLLTTNYYSRGDERVIRIPNLHSNDTLVDMRDKLLKDACWRFKRAKRCRKWKFSAYQKAVDSFNEAASLSTEFNLPLPTSADLPEDFQSWLVVETFKVKADGDPDKLSLSSYATSRPLHPCYTSTLSPSCAAAA